MIQALDWVILIVTLQAVLSVGLAVMGVILARVIARQSETMKRQEDTVAMLGDLVKRSPLWALRSLAEKNKQQAQEEERRWGQG